MLCKIFVPFGYLIGASWEKFALGARFINLTVGTARHFYMMQHQYRASYFDNSMIILKYTCTGTDLEGGGKSGASGPPWNLQNFISPILLEMRK